LEYLQKPRAFVDLNFRVALGRTDNESMSHTLVVSVAVVIGEGARSDETIPIGQRMLAVQRVGECRNMDMNNSLVASYDASTGRFAQLESGERLFLWGFRTMAQHRGCACPIAAVIRQVYGQFLVADAVASVETLVEAFAGTAHTAISVHSPCCPCVSEGETFLLRAMAAAQCADLDAARRQFEHWLPELAADWILGAAYGVGRIFKAAGMTLPMRDPGTISMEDDPEPGHWPAMSTARH